MTKNLFNKLITLIAFFLIFGSFYSLVQAKQKQSLPKIQTAKLSNGLQVVMKEDHKLPLTAIQVWYHVGSKNEKLGKTGFAHLFEHLMFKETKNLPSEMFDKLTENIGGMTNAFTSDDMTVYLEVIPSNHLKRLLWAEADRMGGLQVTEGNFLPERDVVKEERRLRVDNAPYGKVDEVLYSAIFSKHPYQHTPIGSIEDLNRATLADVKEFHSTYYAPNNATLVIVGDFEPGKILPVIKEYFEKIPEIKSIPRVQEVEPPQKEERRLTFTDPTAPLPQVIIAYHVPEDGHPDVYPLSILGNILSNGKSSRLYQSLIYKQQSAVQVSAYGDFREHPNLFFTTATLSPNGKINVIEKSLLEELNNICNKQVSSAELQKAKNQVISATVLSRQSLLGQAEALGLATTFFGDPMRAFTNLDKFKSVTTADIQRVARKYFTVSNRTIMHVLTPAEGDKK